MNHPLAGVQASPSQGVALSHKSDRFGRRLIELAPPLFALADNLPPPLFPYRSFVRSSDRASEAKPNTLGRSDCTCSVCNIPLFITNAQKR